MTTAGAPLGTRTLGLLRDALAYTGGVLRALPDECAGVPTPCRDWDLDRLLAHLEDALDAFTEAAGGVVRVDPPYPADDRGAAGRPARLRRKAHDLGRVWTPAAATDVRLGERTLAAELLVPAAALEVAVHGWDVAHAVGAPDPDPKPFLDPALARGLAPVAALLVPRGPARQGRFDQPPASLAGPEDDLLGWLGRGPGASPCGGVSPWAG